MDADFIPTEKLKKKKKSKFEEALLRKKPVFNPGKFFLNSYLFVLISLNHHYLHYDKKFLPSIKSFENDRCQL